MLIDAAHPEETRVAIIDDQNVLTDYDFKSTFKHTIKGNIYLAKVARVEPSLQAAFIDYGGNRHGFMAFSEIHPDYFRIPVADRELIDAELKGLVSPENLESEDDLESSSTPEQMDFEQDEEQNYKMPISTIGGDQPLHEDSDSENYFRKLSLHRRYKIQEVIYRNQILLVQVIKEERGGKGAALTTYLSLPGRYCVLMPNSPRSGGISRKISNAQDRKRLRKILESLEIPEGMGLIIRTAGKERTKAELKRDAEYLMRLWNTIRETTLKSIAPALIYEEDDIIKRAIRDLYTKDTDSIMVEGEESYKIARNFMKTLMPSHSKRIQLYKSDISPLFHHYGVERQIDRMHEAQVTLPSGGSIVIHPTEALVSIDINSGRATRERHIEETATKTNLEAAVEIARQVRLRDLAGLIVIDFIDMEEARNVAAVERRVKEVFRHDRARIQVGKISPFGLLELSRQRLAPSILETSASPCPHCNSTGYIRSTESKALQILRAIEEEGTIHTVSEMTVTLPSIIASYIFNKKRQHLSTIEQRHNLTVVFEFNDHLEKPGYKIGTGKKPILISAETKNSENTHKNSKPFPKARNIQPVEEEVLSKTAPSNTQAEDPQNRNRSPEDNNRRRNNRRPAGSHKKDLNPNQKNDSTVTDTDNLEKISAMPITSGNSERSAIENEARSSVAAAEGSENPAQVDTQPGNSENRRRNNRRRNNRRHLRSGNRNTPGNVESSQEGNSPSIESPITIAPGNQNDQKKTPEFQKAEKPIASAESKAAAKDKNAKGWWKRLLE